MRAWAVSGVGFTPEQLAEMLRLANRAIDELLEIQRDALAVRAGR